MNIYPLNVYTGRVFSVELDYIWLPNGKEKHVATVRHGPSVVLIPIQDDGRVVMIRQFRYPLKQELWELPAGGVEAGETPEAAAVRECEEEIGLVPTTIERLGSFYPIPGYGDEEMIFFRVSGLRPPPPDSPHKPDEDEDIRQSALTAADAKGMLARGEIKDLKTAYALMLL